MRIPFQTLSNYERTREPLRDEIVKKAAAFYKVSETEVRTAPPEASVKEETTPYRTTSIPVGIFTDTELAELNKSFSHRLTQKRGQEWGILYEALGAIGGELDRRAELASVTLDYNAALQKQYGDDSEPDASGESAGGPHTGEGPSGDPNKSSPGVQGQSVPPSGREARRSQK